MRHQVAYKITITGTLCVDASNEVEASEAARLALQRLARYDELPDELDMGPAQDEVEIESAEPYQFECEGHTFDTQAQAAQHAEHLHARDGVAHRVTALLDDMYGMFTEGEVVYESKGGPD